MGALIVLGALPATYLCVFSVMVGFAGLFALFEEPSWTNFEWFIAGASGVIGTLSIWRIALGREATYAYFGLMFGIFAILYLPFLGSEQVTTNWSELFTSIFALPVGVAVYLIVELLVRVRRFSKERLVGGSD